MYFSLKRREGRKAVCIIGVYVDDLLITGIKYHISNKEKLNGVEINIKVSNENKFIKENNESYVIKVCLIRIISEETKIINIIKNKNKQNTNNKNNDKQENKDNSKLTNKLIYNNKYKQMKKHLFE